LIDDDGIEKLRADLKAEVDEAVDRAWNAPDPDPESATLHLYADD